MPHNKLRARDAVDYQHQNPLDNQKSTSTINAYIYIKMTKSQDETNKKQKQTKSRRRRSTIMTYRDVISFSSRSIRCFLGGIL